MASVVLQVEKALGINLESPCSASYSSYQSFTFSLVSSSPHTGLNVRKAPIPKLEL